MADISTTATAKLARADLKRAFPQTKFSVTSKKYAGGSSIDVRWDGGPTSKQVQGVAGKYHGSSFDPMQDLLEPTGAPYINHFIFFHRSLPDATVEREMQALAKEYHFEDMLLKPDAYDNKKLAELMSAVFQQRVMSLREAAQASLAQKDLSPLGIALVRFIEKRREVAAAQLRFIEKRREVAAAQRPRPQTVEEAPRGNAVSPVGESPRHKALRARYTAEHRKPRLSR
jgi:hypothetical protein